MNNLVWKHNNIVYLKYVPLLFKNVFLVEHPKPWLGWFFVQRRQVERKWQESKPEVSFCLAQSLLTLCLSGFGQNEKLRDVL